MADSGYQGLQKTHSNMVIPQKGSEKKPLDKEGKKHNHEVSSQRVMVEHTIRRLKVWSNGQK